MNDPAPRLRPDEFDEVGDWIGRQLAARVMPPTGPIETLKSWSVSVVLRVPTASGDVYFKAVPRLFAAEPVVTLALAELCPRRVPEVLAIEAERRWLLARDAGRKLQSVMSASLQAQLREGAVRSLAAIQRASIDQTGGLLTAGACDRRLARLLGHIDGLLAEATDLDDAEPALLDQVRAAEPELQALAERLVEVGIPDTLVHGDFHNGNVAVRDGDVVIFDWANAGISHPFLDLVTFLDERATGRDAPDEDILREAYLDAWRGYAEPANLRQAFEIGKTLGALQQAMIYQRIMRGLGPVDRLTCAGGIRIALSYVVRRLDSVDEHHR